MSSLCIQPKSWHKQVNIFLRWLHFFCTFYWCRSCFEYWCNYFVNNCVFLICLSCFAWRAGGWQQSIICAELVSEQQSIGESDLIRKEEPTWFNRGWILNWGVSVGPPGNSGGLSQGGGFAFWSQKLNCWFLFPWCRTLGSALLLGRDFGHILTSKGHEKPLGFHARGSSPAQETTWETTSPNCHPALL